MTPELKTYWLRVAELSNSRRLKEWDESKTTTTLPFLTAIGHRINLIYNKTPLILLRTLCGFAQSK